ncbi:AMP-binding protein [Streptomyces sp. NPDC059152]|uniref:AMP-binding protein n=1 Tax=Streptomyces sp. NPDC059152 TaxID=3346742 RepID=UPI00368F9523
MNAASHPDTSPGNLVEALRRRAERNPDGVLYTYLRNGEEAAESLTSGALDRAARARAVLLRNAGLAGGNVLLAHPHDLEFVRAFAGCLYAGVAGGPVKFPRSNHDLRRLLPVARAAGTTTVLTTRAGHQELLERFPDAAELRDLQWIETDAVDESAAGDWTPTEVSGSDLALLQFTSGSTGQPKGVMVSHDNFARQSSEMNDALAIGSDGVLVSWAPFFHDLGLVFSVVNPLWLGTPVYLMAPESFIRRPRRLLEAISRFRGTHCGGPNFSYDLCVRSAADEVDQLDLSSWRVAINGAETVRDATLRAFAETFKSAGFDPRVATPVYGMAETTLIVTAKPLGEEPRTLWVSASSLANDRIVPVAPESPDATPVVSCGVTQPGTRVRIVDPVRALPCDDGEIGEIWVQGPCITGGYWKLPDVTEETFGARIAGQEAEGAFLRTGDLGFRYDGELFVAGRLKDVIILQGHNHYPQDIEYVAESCHPSLASGATAAFPVERDGEERLAVVVEVAGGVAKEVGAEALAQRVRDAIWEDCQVTAAEVVIVRRGALAKTTSGKIQRRECRRRLESGEFERATLAALSSAPGRPAPGSTPAAATALPGALLKPLVRTLLSRIVGVAPAEIADDRSFSHYGLNSIGAEQLAAALEPVVGRPVPVMQVLNHATVDQLTAALGASGEAQ